MKNVFHYFKCENYATHLMVILKNCQILFLGIQIIRLQGFSPMAHSCLLEYILQCSISTVVFLDNSKYFH